METTQMATVETTSSSVTEQVAKDILKAFETSEYLNIADFRLLAKGHDSQTLDAAIDYLIENEYMVDLDADDYDVETGNAETIFARIVPIGSHQE
jgi:ribosomal silencing factor RsfS